MNNIQRANGLLKIDQSYLSNPDGFTDYFNNNINDEKRLTPTQSQAYMKEKKKYVSARQKYKSVAENPDLTDNQKLPFATLFVLAYDKYTALKAQFDFRFLSLADYFQETKITPQIMAANRLGF